MVVAAGVSSDPGGFALIVLSLVGFVGTVFLSAYIAADMGRRGRSQFGWFLVSFVLTLPLALLLWLVARRHYPTVDGNIPSAL